MFKCMKCGKSLRWNGDFTNEEIYGKDEPKGVTGIYSCDECNINYEIATYQESDDIKVMVYVNEE